MDQGYPVRAGSPRGQLPPLGRVLSVTWAFVGVISQSLFPPCQLDPHARETTIEKRKSHLTFSGESGQNPSSFCFASIKIGPGEPAITGNTAGFRIYSEAPHPILPKGTFRGSEWISLLSKSQSTALSDRFLKFQGMVSNVTLFET